VIFDLTGARKEGSNGGRGYYARRGKRYTPLGGNGGQASGGVSLRKFPSDLPTMK
jgi:hypothetical protein